MSVNSIVYATYTPLPNEAISGPLVVRLVFCFSADELLEAGEEWYDIDVGNGFIISVPGNQLSEFCEV